MAGDDGIPSKPACEQRPDLAGCEVYKKKFKKVKVPPKTGVNNGVLASDGTPSEPDSMYGDDGISHGPSTVPMTDEAKRALAERQAGETPVAARSGAPSSAYLPQNHQAQQKNWWCGPATATMALGHMGVKTSQLAMARKFGNVTKVTGPGLATMQSVMTNMGGGRFAWDRADLPYTPNASHKATYKKRLLNSINGFTTSKKKYPLVANLYLVPKGPRPLGYPTGNVRHFIEIRGYKNSGRDSQVQDPASSVWKKVRAHYSVNSDSLVVMMGARGYLY